MKETTIGYAAEASGGRVIAGSEQRTFSAVSIDSRRVGEKDLFVAICGERRDAHQFLPEVCAKGCRAVLISDPAWAERLRGYADLSVILVPDTTAALERLAKRYLADWQGLRRIGITGSVGKTSTKEFTAAVLGSRYRTGKTPGNLNNVYGIPLSIFGFPEEIEAAVLEMGAGPGPSLRELSGIVQPEILLITSVGTSHLETFGTREALAREKLNAASACRPGDVVIVNADCDLLEPERVRAQLPEGVRLRTVGSRERDDYQISEVRDYGIQGVQGQLLLREAAGTRSLPLRLSVSGIHNLGNAALALAAGIECGVDPEQAIRALSRASIADGRLEITHPGDITLINDSYNASPESMKAAIQVLAATPASRRVAILGDMYELGAESDALHESVGLFLAEQGIDLLISIGASAQAIARGAGAAASGGRPQVYAYPDKATALPELMQRIQPGDLVLVKASRGMGLEDIVAALSGGEQGTRPSDR